MTEKEENLLEEEAEELNEDLENPEEQEAEEDSAEDGQEVGDETEESSENTSKKVITMKEMLDAGIHFGHRTMRWNVKMSPYIYGVRNNIHIIDLTQTAIMMKEACRILREIAKKRGKILFICTKKQGSKSVRELAEKNNQFYVTNKWLGGMLTNWKTVSQSIRKIKSIENQMADDSLLKKEKVVLSKMLEKLKINLDGVKTMGGLPDIIFVIDSIKESLAIHEARSLGIPVMAIADTNSNPDVIDYIIPGNDDSIKAIQLYCDAIDASLSDIKIVRTEKKVFAGKKNNNNMLKRKPKPEAREKRNNVKKPIIKRVEKKEEKTNE